MKATPETLLRQATMTMDTYLNDIVKKLDSRFEKGYSANNPEIVSAMLIGASIDYTGSLLAQTHQDGMSEIAASISELAAAMRSR